MSEDSGVNAIAKDWHASKYIGKRARHLLNHPDEEIPSDVSFLVGDGRGEPQKIFKCHKFLLAMMSAMFQTMFYGSFPQTDGPVKIPDVTPTAFQTMLRYAYGEIIGSDDVGTWQSGGRTGYPVLRKYMVDKLADVCRDRIQQPIATFDVDPCVVFQRAPQMDEEDLAALALARISLNTTDVLQGDSFLRISLDRLKKIVECPHLAAQESDVYQGVRRWVEHNVDAVNGLTLRETFGSLLDSIRFPLFSSSELTDGPVSDGVMSADEASSVVQFPLAEVNPVLPYLITPRCPLLAPLLCTFTRVSRNALTQESLDYMRQVGMPIRATDRKMDTKLLQLEARPDLAPECCAVLRRLLEAKVDIGIAFYGHFHPERCCYTRPSNKASVPAAVAQEVNVLSHSVRGACWFEWDVEQGRPRNVRIGVGRKPSLHHSAVFGFLLGFEDDDDEKQWVPFHLWDEKRTEDVAGFGMTLTEIA